MLAEYNLGDALWTMLAIFFMVIYFMILFTCITDLFRDHETNGFVKALWILAFIFTNFLGLLIYLIVRGGGMAGRAAAAQKQMQEAQVEYAKAIVAQSDGAAASSTDQIAKAHDLLQSGANTQAEFDAIKTKALA